MLGDWILRTGTGCGICGKLDHLLNDDTPSARMMDLLNGWIIYVYLCNIHGVLYLYCSFVVIISVWSQDLILT